MMSDLALGCSTTPSAVGPGDNAKLGLVMILALAVASAMVGLHNPDAFVAEYQTAAPVSASP